MVWSGRQPVDCNMQSPETYHWDFRVIMSHSSLQLYLYDMLMLFDLLFWDTLVMWSRSMASKWSFSSISFSCVPPHFLFLVTNWL